MTTQRTYWILLTREQDTQWSVAFGDYSRTVVEQERVDSYADAFRWRVLKTFDSQASVNEAVASLNETLAIHQMVEVRG